MFSLWIFPFLVCSLAVDQEDRKFDLSDIHTWKRWMTALVMLGWDMHREILTREIVDRLPGFGEEAYDFVASLLMSLDTSEMKRALKEIVDGGVSINVFRKIVHRLDRPYYTVTYSKIFSREEGEEVSDWDESGFIVDGEECTGDDDFIWNFIDPSDDMDYPEDHDEDEAIAVVMAEILDNKVSCLELGEWSSSQPCSDNWLSFIEGNNRNDPWGTEKETSYHFKNFSEKSFNRLVELVGPRWRRSKANVT
jgi:hypothetical protein